MHLFRKIKDLDFFGHQIELNFNKNGSAHKTVLGGFVSILIRCLMGFYVYLLVKKFVLYEDDKNTSVLTHNDLAKLDTVDLDKTHT